MNFTYETDRLIMKVCGTEIAEDALVFFLHNAREFEAVEPIDEENFYTIEHQKNILNYEYKRTLNLAQIRYWLYLKEDPDTIIGTVCFRNIARPIFSSCQVGYKMDKAYTGHGYCKEALKAGINIMFKEMGLHRIEAMVLPTNQVSIGLLESLGFEREGLMKDKIMLQGVYRDHYSYALINKNN